MKEFKKMMNEPFSSLSFTEKVAVLFTAGFAGLCAACLLAPYLTDFFWFVYFLVKEMPYESIPLLIVVFIIGYLTRLFQK